MKWGDDLMEMCDQGNLCFKWELLQHVYRLRGKLDDAGERGDNCQNKVLE